MGSRPRPIADGGAADLRRTTIQQAVAGVGDELLILYSAAMRVVFDAIDRFGIRYYVTGSVAASIYGVLRQTHDTDVVLDLDSVGFEPLADALRASHAIADPIE